MFELGNSLREARIRRGLDFYELEQATKVRAKYLRALEDEHFDVLPSQTYVKGFLRAYADALGLDGQLFVDEYNSRFAAGRDVFEERIVQPRRSRAKPRREHRLERNAVLLTVVGIGVVAALVIAAWRFGGESPRTAPPAPAVTPPPAANPLPVQAKIVVRALRGPSLVIVRRRGARGEVLHNGTLPKGKSKRFKADKLWLNLGTPTNLELVLNGKRYSVGGPKPCVVIVTPLAIRPAARDSC